jgi:hypothetical protein
MQAKSSVGSSLSCSGFEVQPALIHWLMTVILATWENHLFKPTWKNSTQDPISKITSPKWTGGGDQVIKSLITSMKH